MIPRLVHRVWLGPGTPPAEYDYARAWEATNPGWQLVTWTDDLVAGLDLVAQDAYDRAPTYVHRADIVLAEVVYRFGGVAVGWDTEPLRALDPLVDSVPGWALAWCTEDSDGWPGQAFFGAEGRASRIAGWRERDPLLELLVRLRDRAAGWSFVPGVANTWPPPHVATGPYLWRDVFGDVAVLRDMGGPGAGQWPLQLRHGMVCLGGQELAYPVNYRDKGLLTDPGRQEELAAALAPAFVVHRFMHSWAALDDVKVQR